jgi:hypothetical protein
MISRVGVRILVSAAGFHQPNRIISRSPWTKKIGTMNGSAPKRWRWRVNVVRQIFGTDTI